PRFVILDEKRLENAAPQHRLLIMDLSVNQRCYHEPVWPDDFIGYAVCPFARRFGERTPKSFVIHVVTTVHAHLSAAFFGSKHLAVAVFRFALRYQQIGGI